MDNRFYKRPCVRRARTPARTAEDFHKQALNPIRTPRRRFPLTPLALAALGAVAALASAFVVGASLFRREPQPGGGKHR